MTDTGTSSAATTVLVTLGLGLLVTAAFGLARLARGRRLALTGAALVVVGAPAGAATNAVTDLVAYRLTDPHLSPDSAVDVYAASLGPAVAVMFLLYVLVLPGMVRLATASCSAWPPAKDPPALCSAFRCVSACCSPPGGS